MRSSTQRIHSATDGGADISFILALPIFAFLLSVLVQLVLIANAKLVVNHAAFVASRSAATSLAEGDGVAPRIAAGLVLASISPATSGGALRGASGNAYAKGVESFGWQLAGTDSRYQYAAAATLLEWTPDGSDFSSRHGETMTLTLRYRFQLTVPMAARLLSSRSEAVAGVPGRFLDLSQTVRFHRAPGRRHGGVLGVGERI